MSNVQLQKALNYCIQTGASVSESATKFKVDANELSKMLSKSLNPNGGGKPEDGFSKNYDINFPYKGGGKVKVARLATQKLPSGRSVEAFVDKNGKQYFQYRAADGKIITEEHFRKVENFKGEYHVNNGKFEVAIKIDTPSQAELDKKRADYKNSMKENIKNKKWGKAFADAYNYKKTPEQAGLQKATFASPIIPMQVFGVSEIGAGAAIGAAILVGGAFLDSYLNPIEINQSVSIDINNVDYKDLTPEQREKLSPEILEKLKNKTQE